MNVFGDEPSRGLARPTDRPGPMRERVGPEPVKPPPVCDDRAVASLVSPVLVGREAEVARLDRALSEAEGRRRLAVLIGGEAGVGKSRLVDELVAHARGWDLRILTGGCV